MCIFGRETARMNCERKGRAIGQHTLLLRVGHSRKYPNRNHATRLYSLWTCSQVGPFNSVRLRSADWVFFWECVLVRPTTVFKKQVLRNDAQFIFKYYRDRNIHRYICHSRSCWISRVCGEAPYVCRANTHPNGHVMPSGLCFCALKVL